MGFKVYLLLSVLTIIITTLLIIYQNTAEKVNSLKPFSAEQISPVELVSEPPKSSASTARDSIRQAANILQKKRTLSIFKELPKVTDKPITSATSESCKVDQKDSIHKYIISSSNPDAGADINKLVLEPATTDNTDINRPPSEIGNPENIIKINDKISDTKTTKLPPWKCA